MKNIIPLTLIGIFILLFLITYRLFTPQPLTRDECYRLGSNERTLLCLSEFEASKPTLPPFPINDLKILSVGSGDGRSMPITIKNENSHIAEKVIIKAEFMQKKDAPVFDTTYTDIGIIGSGDTVTRQIPVSIHPNTYVQLRISNAEYLN